MVRLGLLLLCLSSQVLSAQIRGRVIDAETGEPLPFVNITINEGKEGAAADIDGRFNLPYNRSDVRLLKFSFIGYQSLQTAPKEDGATYALQPNSEALPEVTVLPGENPAHRIVKKAVANREKNNPTELPQFSYRAYSKFILGVNADSVRFIADTSSTSLDSAALARDSVIRERVEFANRQYLFMLETLTKRAFIKGSRDVEEVIAQRTSGFKNPLFSLVTTQMQSFSFYDDYFSVLGTDFLNPITKGSTSRYFFRIIDTTFNSSSDTVYTISFRPRPNSGINALVGQVSINTSQWAIQNVIATPILPEGNDWSIELHQLYANINQKWFPTQLNAELIFEPTKAGFRLYGDLRTYLSQIDLEGELKKSELSRAKVLIDDQIADNSEELLGQFRVDSLDSKEQFTYTYMDSLGEAENFEGKLRIYSAILTGKIPVYWVDLELNKLLRYNEYEGIRLGLGAHTNRRFHDKLVLGGYFGYGFKDQVMKYGYDASWYFNRVYNLKVTGGYSFDLTETASLQYSQQPPLGVFQDNYRTLFVRQFDRNSMAFGHLNYDPIPNLQLQLGLRRENRFVLGDYRFLTTDGEQAILRNGFTYTETYLGMRWSPYEDVVEASGYGRIRLSEAYPVVYADLARGIQGLLDGSFSYTKLNVRVRHQIKNVQWGRSIFELSGGTVFSADLPASKLYTGLSNGVIANDFWERLQAVADRNSFETMRFNEFLNDTYLQFNFRQDFQSLLFESGDFKPHIEVVSRAAWGMLDNPERHLNFNTRDLRHVYLESGFELNRLYVSDFSAFGLGFYYRYGAYAFPTFEQNFTLKLSSKFTL